MNTSTDRDAQQLQRLLHEREQARRDLHHARERLHETTRAVHEMLQRLEDDASPGLQDDDGAAHGDSDAASAFTEARPAPIRRGRPPVHGTTHKRFVLDQLADGPKPTATLREAWRRSGRRGRIDNVLSTLRHEGRIVTDDGVNRLAGEPGVDADPKV